MNLPARRLLLLAVALLAVGSLTVPLALALARSPAAPPSAVVGRAAPVLAGPTLDDGSFDLADLRGSVVVVNVWASWCGPCREEMPLLADAARRWSPDGLRVVGIDVDDDPDAARAFLAGLGGVPFPSVVDDGRLAVEWGTTGVPETFVVDADGTVVARHIGPVTAEWLAEEAVARLAP